MIRNNTNKRLKEHVERLKKERDERQEIAEILDKRLRSLTSSCVRIHIPNDMNYLENRRQLDLGIRTISSIAKGTYDPIEVAKKYYASYQQIVDSMFTEDEQEDNIYTGEKNNE